MTDTKRNTSIDKRNQKFHIESTQAEAEIALVKLLTRQQAIGL